MPPIEPSDFPPGADGEANADEVLTAAETEFAHLPGASVGVIVTYLENTRIGALKVWPGGALWRAMRDHLVEPVGKGPGLSPEAADALLDRIWRAAPNARLAAARLAIGADA